MRAGGAKAMSSTTKDTAAKGTNTDKRKSTQHKTAHTAPVTIKLAGLPLDELKYLRDEMRLG